MEQLLPFISHHWPLVGTFVVALSYLMFLELGPQIGDVQRLSPGEVTTLMNRQKGKVLDLRSLSQFEAGHILEALHVDAAKGVEMVAKRIKDKRRPLILVSDAHKVAMDFGAALREAGYESVVALRGGINAWKEAKMPLVS